MPVIAHRAQRGVGLIEVLIAFTVFSIGVMGTFRMQIAAKMASYESSQQLIATNLANDLLERIRDNKNQLDAYLVEGMDEPGEAPVENCKTAACSAEQLAANDLYEWSALLNGAGERLSWEGVEVFSGGLVMPRVCIRRDGRYVSVSINWKSKGQFGGVSEPLCKSGETPPGEQRSEVTLSTYMGSL